MAGSKAPPTVTDTSDASTPQAAASRATRFEQNDLVAERYRVMRFIARGGMGEVYEVLDVRVGAKVALKCIALERSARARAVERLHREMLLARRVTHESVGRVHDLGVHIDGDEVVDFLTMDLLEGETLAAWLDARPPLAPAEALALLAPMTRALDAIHAQGIVHRDFKPANVILRRRGEALEPVVMDFGIAAHENREEGDLETLHGPAIGSPAYMAPEQVAGERAAVRSDVYALGVVLFQMMTGALPFRGESAAATATRRLVQDAPSARSLRRDLPAHWDRVIARCLARRPEERFVSAGAVLEALQRPTHGVTPRRVGAALLVVAVLGGAFAGVPMLRRHLSGREAPASSSRPVVAVLPLTANASTKEGTSVVSSELLAGSLGAHGDLRVLDGATVARGRRDALREGDAADAADGTLAKTLGADMVVSGAVEAQGDEVRLVVRVQDAGGHEMFRGSVGGASKDLYDTVDELGDRVATALGARVQTSDERDALRAARPRSPETFEAVALALAQKRRGDLEGARDRLKAATLAEPAFVLAHAELGSVLGALGYEAEALESLRVAKENAGSLSREARVLLEARYEGAQKHWERAVELYRGLRDFYPDDAEYGLAHLRALAAAGHAKEALTEVTSVSTRSVAEGIARDLLEGDLATKVADFGRAARAGEAALSKSEALGSGRGAADARTLLATAHSFAGDREAASRELEAAARFYASVGDTDAEAQVVSGFADLVDERGDASHAEDLRRRAVALARVAGNRLRLATVLNGLGMTFVRRGQAARAREPWAEALALFREVGDREGTAHMQNNLGAVDLDEGRGVDARPRFEEALAIHEAIGARMGQLNELANLCTLELAAGNVAESTARCASAATLAREVGDTPHRAGVSLRQARLRREQEDFTGARALATESLRLYAANDAGDKTAARIALAEIALAEGHSVEAEATAREALAELSEGGEPTADDGAPAVPVLVRALLALGRLEDAAKLAPLLGAAKDGYPEILVRIDNGLALASLDARRGERAAALELLRAEQRRAEDASLVVLALEARLERARVSHDRAELGAVAKAATEHGLLRLAAEAKSAGRRTP